MAALRPSQRLRFKIALAAPALERLSEGFWRHPRLEAIFPDYLETLYWSMQATVPLLREAARRARALARHDRLAAALVPYLARHAREELHHDEWLLDDLEAVGRKRAEVQAGLPPATVAAMIGCQYFWIRHAHPVALLGCFAVLEGSPVATATLEDLLARTTLPRQALRTIFKHAGLDPHHRDELDRLVDGLELPPRHEALVGLSALTVTRQLTEILEELTAVER